MTKNEALNAAAAADAKYDETGNPAFAELEVAYKMLADALPREKKELERNVAMILAEVFETL